MEVLAPMPGKIVDVLVNAGDKVSEDDELLIIEAMKMENPICAEAEGVVKEVMVKKGDTVSVGQVMMTLE